MAVSFRGNSIHAPSRDLSVLPRLSRPVRVTAAVRYGAIMALEVRAADGSIISARVSHSHACDLRAPTLPGTGSPRNLREQPTPSPIVLQLLTALLPCLNEGLIAFECFDSCHAIGAGDCSVASADSSALLPANPPSKFVPPISNSAMHSE